MLVNHLELLFDVAEHQLYLKDAVNKQIYFMLGNYCAGDCGFLSALAAYFSPVQCVTAQPITITRMANVGATASLSPKFEVDFQFYDLDHEQKMHKRSQTLVFRRYHADALAALASFS